MAKYAFNHDAQKLSDVTGISEERWDELNCASKATIMAAFLTDNNITDDGKALEMLINEGQPSTVVEAMALGFIFGCSLEKAKVILQKISAIIKQ